MKRLYSIPVYMTCASYIKHLFERFEQSKLELFDVFHFTINIIINVLLYCYGIGLCL